MFSLWQYDVTGREDETTTARVQLRGAARVAQRRDERHQRRYPTAKGNTECAFAVEALWEDEGVHMDDGNSEDEVTVQLVSRKARLRPQSACSQRHQTQPGSLEAGQSALEVTESGKPRIRPQSAKLSRRMDDRLSSPQRREQLAWLPTEIKSSKWTELLHSSPSFHDQKLQKLEAETFSLLRSVLKKPKRARTGIADKAARTDEVNADKQHDKILQSQECKESKETIARGSGLQVARTKKMTPEDKQALLSQRRRARPVTCGRAKQHRERLHVPQAGEQHDLVKKTKMLSERFENVPQRKEKKENTRLPEKYLDTQTRNAAAQMRIMAELDWLTETPLSIEKSKVPKKKPPVKKKYMKTNVLSHDINVKPEKLSIEGTILQKNFQPSNQSERVEPRAAESTATSTKVILPPDDTMEHMQFIADAMVRSIEISDEEQARTLESANPLTIEPLLDLSGETNSPFCGVAETHGSEILDNEPKQPSGSDVCEVSASPASENSPEFDPEISSGVREMTKEEESLGIEDSEGSQIEQQSDFAEDNVTSILVLKEVGSGPSDQPATVEMEEGENDIAHGLEIIVPEDSIHEACADICVSHEGCSSGPASNETTHGSNVEGVESVKDADIIVIQPEEDTPSDTGCIPSDRIKIPDDKLDDFQGKGPREAIHSCHDHDEDDSMFANSLPNTVEPRLTLLAEHIEELFIELSDQISEPSERNESVKTEPTFSTESVDDDANESQAQPWVVDEHLSSPSAIQKYETMGTSGEERDTSLNPETSEPQKNYGQEEYGSVKHEAARVIQNQWQTTLVKRMLSEHVDLISRHQEGEIYKQDLIWIEANEIEQSSIELPVVLLNTSTASNICEAFNSEGASDVKDQPGSSRDPVLLNEGSQDGQEEGAEARRLPEDPVGLNISTPEALGDDIVTNENATMVDLMKGSDGKTGEPVGATQNEASEAVSTVTQDTDLMELFETNVNFQEGAIIDDSPARLPAADVLHVESDEKDPGRATEHLPVSLIDTQSNHYDSSSVNVANADAPAQDSPLFFSVVEKQTDAGDSHHDLDSSFNGIIDEAISRVVIELIIGLVDMVIKHTNATSEIFEKPVIASLVVGIGAEKIELVEDCDTDSCNDTPQGIKDVNETPLPVVAHAVDLCDDTSPKAKQIESPTSFKKEENKEDMASCRIQTQYRRYRARLLMLEEMRFLLQQRRRETRKKTRRESAQVATLLGVAAISETLGIKAGTETPHIQDTVTSVSVTGESHEDIPERIPTEVVKDRATANEDERRGPLEEESFQCEAKPVELIVVTEEETNKIAEMTGDAEVTELEDNYALPGSEYFPHFNTVANMEINDMPVESGTTNQEESVGSDPVEVMDSSYDGVWERYMDPATAQPYYYHAKSMISQWEAPQNCVIVNRVEDQGADLVNHDEDEGQGQSTGIKDGVEGSVLVTQHSDVMEILLPTPSPSLSSDDGGFFEEQNSQFGTDTKNSPPVAGVKPEEPEILAENTVKRRKFALGLLDLAMGSPREDEPVDFAMESSDNKFNELELQAATEMLQPVEESGIWQEYVDPVTQEKFYYNALTGESTWEVPIPVVPQAPEKPQAQSPWVQYIDPETSLPYYVNMETYASSWDIPPDLDVAEYRHETSCEQCPVEEEDDDDVEPYEINLYVDRSSRQPLHPS